MKHVTPTELECFQRCPKQHAFRYTDRITAPMNASLWVGHLFHLVMEQFHGSASRDTITIPLAVVEDVITHHRAALVASGADVAAIGHMVTELVAGQNTIEQHWRTHTRSQTVASEVRGHVALSDTIVCDIRIDRIDRTEMGYILIDYKTQETPPGWKAIRTYELLQPWAYGLYGKEQFGDEFLGFVYFLPKLHMIRPVMAWHPTWTPEITHWLPNPKMFLNHETITEHLPLVTHHMTQLAQEIQAGISVPSTLPLSHCRTCSYRYFCEVLHAQR